VSLVQALFVVYLALALVVFWLAFRLGREQRALEEEIAAAEKELTGRVQDTTCPTI